MKSKSTSMKHILKKRLYLLRKSLERYAYFKELGAPAAFIRAEKALIRKQLLFLFNLRAQISH